MGRGAWWATICGVTELDTTEQLTHTHTHPFSPKHKTATMKQGDILLLRVWSQIRSTQITWEPIRNAESQTPPGPAESGSVFHQ